MCMKSDVDKMVEECCDIQEFVSSTSTSENPQPKYLYTILQQEPYTAMRLWPLTTGEVSMTVGFSKCNPNFDEWDPERGKDIALRRAIKQMIRGKNQ